jgi:SLOG family YspA-like protein
VTRPLRILVTGSRDWTDIDAIDHAIRAALMTYRTDQPPVLIHGCAAGADALADKLWTGWLSARRTTGSPPWPEPERYPARDFPSPRARNQHMVDLGATVCLVFALDWASGTGMCARMARRAGIRVIDYGVPTGNQGAT